MNKEEKHKHENLDDPQTSIERKKIIQKKLFLRNCYINFYNQIKSELTAQNKKGFIVELGSGAGFIQKVIKNTTTSDIMKLPGIDLNFSGTKMPFKNNSVNALVMVDVFHHIDDVEKFFEESYRCLKPGGQIIMIEPSNTIFGKFMYKNFHPEPFKPNAGWKFKSSGPLSDANSALPWIVFFRDRKKFEKKFPLLKVIKIQAHTPLIYILSGGLSFRQMLPDSLYPLVKFIEFLLTPLNSLIGLFYIITVVKEK